MTQQDKMNKFKSGYWRAPAPPVSTGLWSDWDWVAYIDSYKGWF